MRLIIKYTCPCGNTHLTKDAAIICTHDKLEGNTMAQPPGKTRATPTRAKKRPTTTAAKKRKQRTKKA